MFTLDGKLLREISLEHFVNRARCNRVVGRARITHDLLASVLITKSDCGDSRRTRAHEDSLASTASRDRTGSARIPRAKARSGKFPRAKPHLLRTEARSVQFPRAKARLTEPRATSRRTFLVQISQREPASPNRTRAKPRLPARVGVRESEERYQTPSRSRARSRMPRERTSGSQR